MSTDLSRVSTTNMKSNIFYVFLPKNFEKLTNQNGEPKIYLETRMDMELTKNQQELLMDESGVAKKLKNRDNTSHMDENIGVAKKDED